MKYELKSTRLTPRLGFGVGTSSFELSKNWNRFPLMSSSKWSFTASSSCGIINIAEGECGVSIQDLWGCLWGYNSNFILGTASAHHFHEWRVFIISFLLMLIRPAGLNLVQVLFWLLPMTATLQRHISIERKIKLDRHYEMGFSAFTRHNLCSDFKIRILIRLVNSRCLPRFQNEQPHISPWKGPNLENFALLDRWRTCW